MDTDHGLVQRAVHFPQREAYMRLNNHAKEGQTDLLFRKGNVVIIMSASTPGLAQRFARHIANEIQN